MFRSFKEETRVQLLKNEKTITDLINRLTIQESENKLMKNQLATAFAKIDEVKNNPQHKK